MYYFLAGDNLRMTRKYPDAFRSTAISSFRLLRRVTIPSCYCYLFLMQRRLKQNGALHWLGHLFFLSHKKIVRFDPLSFAHATQTCVYL